MDNSVLALLREIQGAGGSQGLGVVDQRLEAARKLRDSHRGNSYMPKGNSGQVADFSGFVGDIVGGRKAEQEVSQLEKLQAQMMRDQTTRARDGLNQSIRQISGHTNQIDAFEDMPAQPLAGVKEEGREEFNALQGATRGMDPIAAQEAVGKYGLSKSLWQQQQLNKAPTSGGMTTLLQLATAYKQAHPNATYDEAMAAAQKQLETFTVTDVGGVPTAFGNRFAGTSQLGSLEGEVAGAGAIAEGSAMGTAFGKGNAEWQLLGPQRQSQTEALVREMEAFVDKAKRIKNNPSLWRSTGFMTYLPSLRGSEGANLDADIESLRAATGLTGLTALKQSGVTLGQVTQAEHDLLQNEIASLSQIQDDETFMRQVQRIIDRTERLMSTARGEFATMYGEGAKPRPTMLPKSNPAAPAAPAGAISLDEYLAGQGG